MPNPRRLLIGVSPRLLRQVPAELGFKGKTLQYLEQSVAHWVMAHGAMVVMIPTVERDGEIRRADIDVGDYVAALDGLILQGGADIDPALYGEQRSEKVGTTDAVRDRFESELLREFAAAKKPVLGICRGMQLINVAFGGTLFQDLEAEGATTTPHVCQTSYDEHQHALRLAADGNFSKWYAGETRLRVNSIHHQAVKVLGSGLSIEASAEDGVVEAIRATAAEFLVGVQWHPEFHDARFPGLLPGEPLLHAFLAAANQRTAQA